MGRSYQLNPRNLGGDLLCLLAGLLYTFYFIFMSRVRQAMAPFPALALATVASIVPLLLLSLAMGRAYLAAQLDAADRACPDQPGVRPDAADLCPRPALAVGRRNSPARPAGGGGECRLDHLWRAARRRT